ncbi:MAG: putative nitrate reductase gamma subunit [Dehalococcoidia bacterium]|nr:putative nitrate reductase gamma subunit [Dehalococcoidia bacterium]
MSVRSYLDTKRSQSSVNGRQYVIPGSSSPMLAVSAQEVHPITAVSVSKVTLDPESPQWSRSQQVAVSLTPQNIAIPRINEAGAKEVKVKAQYDADRLAFLLEWGDQDRRVDMGTVNSFRDAVALQFPSKGAVSPPFYCMGAPNDPVVIYQWKGDWQEGGQSDVDKAYPNMVADEYPFSGKGPGEMPEAMDYVRRGDKVFLTSFAAGNLLADRDLQSRVHSERLQAEGFGSLESSDIQDAMADGFWKNNGWRVVISVPRKQPDFLFQPGAPVPLAFAVWDGTLNERNGKKAFSLWNPLTLQEEGAEGLGLPVLGGIGGAIAAGIGALLFFRMRRMGPRREEDSGSPGGS